MLEDSNHTILLELVWQEGHKQFNQNAKIPFKSK